MQLVGLKGHIGVGKDTAAAGLTDCGWAHLAFADALRDLALAVNPVVDTQPFDDDFVRYNDALATHGYSAAKAYYPEVRGFLQALGTGAREVLGHHVWIEVVERKVANHVAIGTPGVVITDVRFANEAAWIHQQGGIVVEIRRDGHHGDGHISEAGQGLIPADFVLVNDDSPAVLADRLRRVVGVAFRHLPVPH